MATIARHLQKVVVNGSRYVYEEGKLAKDLFILQSGQIVMLKNPINPGTGAYTVKTLGHHPVKIHMAVFSLQ